jgi:signal transduction histidine kinase
MARRVDDAAKRDQILAALIDETDDAIGSLRDLAHGIYPPLLEAEGLETALSSRLAKLPVRVTVTADDVHRYARDIEAAVYFCVLESVQNAIKHADPHHVDVTLRGNGSRLVFEVADNSGGFDSDTRAHGRGLLNMADRLDGLGGTLAIASSPGEGTTITGTLRRIAAAS